MLPYASIFVAVVSFVWAKFASLTSMEQEARDFIQDIVKDELQRLVEKTDIQKMNIPMSQKVLSAIVVGDAGILASTGLSVDVIHDTIAPLKSEINNVCDVLGVDENIIRTIASGNAEEIAQIALRKLDVDPNLFTLMVSIARKDVQASVKSFRKVSTAILGQHDESLINLCESIIQILLEKEGSDIGEVILKKIVTKLLLYTKSKIVHELEEDVVHEVEDGQTKVKMDKQKRLVLIKEILGYINTDLIFTLNHLSSNQSPDTLLELLALIFRAADEKLYFMLRKQDTQYTPMYKYVYKLCREILLQHGKLKSAMCDSKTSVQLLASFLEGIMEHYSQNHVKLKHEIQQNISEVGSSPQTIIAAYQAVSSLVLADSFKVREVIAHHITEQKAKQELIIDVIETGVACAAIDGALNIEDCMNRLVKNITLLPQYKTFVKDRFGDLYGNKLMVACQMFTSIIFPRSLPTLSGIDNILKDLDFKSITERKLLLKARSAFNSLINHPDSNVICNGVPLVQELERRAKILKADLLPFVNVSGLEKKHLFLFVNIFCADDILARAQFSVLWTNLECSKDTKTFLDSIVDFCIFNRNASLCAFIDEKKSKLRVIKRLLSCLKIIWDNEANDKWKQKLGPINLDFSEELKEKGFDELDHGDTCDRFHNDIFNNWSRLKLLTYVSLNYTYLYILLLLSMELFIFD